MEHWVEINLFADRTAQDKILLDVLWPYVKKLRKTGALVTFHYFREPEIRFRVRLRTERQRQAESRTLEGIAGRLKDWKMVSGWKFGNHGEERKPYTGEEDRYGKNGWRVAQKYFEDGAEAALTLMNLKRKSRLENPLWANGIGNLWEGGEKNPWREREEDPLIYHWSRHVHLFTNQLGFDIEDEVKLTAKQSERYRRILEEFGMRW
jgi:hypothetical protein